MRLQFVRVSFYVFCYFSFPIAPGCQPIHYSSPPGYDFSKPQRFIMSDALHEISGIVLKHGNPDTVYAIEDEDGKLYYFHLGAGQYDHSKFGKKGDYEDVAILDDKDFIVLRSDGSLYQFPVSKAGEKKIDSVQEYPNILPAGEYEGLFADKDGRLLAMCKNCPEDKHKEVSIFVLGKNPANLLVVKSQFKVSVKMEPLSSEKKKVKFHPSGLAKNPITNEWYILSSVNKSLIVFDEKWNSTAFYDLDPGTFKQPEGIAFDARGDLFISNEGGSGNANVLQFNRSKQ
jgi:SdiA-regulated